MMRVYNKAAIGLLIYIRYFDIVSYFVVIVCRRPQRIVGTLPQANIYPVQRADVQLGIS